MPQTTFNNYTIGLTNSLTRAMHMLTVKHPKKLPLKRELQQCQEKTALTEQDQPRTTSVSLKKCILEKVSPANMFDSAQRQICSGKVNRTNTPLHALTTLNDPTWVEAARALAERSLKTAGDLDERLSHAFQRVLCRKPGEDDLKVLRRAYRTQAAIYDTDEESAKALLNVGSTPRDESLNTSEHAALTAVCLAIFNFDEALTKE